MNRTTNTSCVFSGIVPEPLPFPSGRLAIDCKNVLFTFEDLSHGIESFSATLLNWGIQPRDRVAIWMNNSAGWLVSFFSLLRLGASVAAIPSLVSSEYGCELLKLMNADHLMVDGTRADTLWQEPSQDTTELAGFSDDHIHRIYDIRDFTDRPTRKVPSALNNVSDSTENECALSFFTPGKTDLPDITTCKLNVLTDMLDELSTAVTMPSGSYPSAFSVASIEWLIFSLCRLRAGECVNVDKVAWL